jgi:hypothetical protein
MPDTAIASADMVDTMIGAVTEEEEVVPDSVIDTVGGATAAATLAAIAAATDFAANTAATDSAVYIAPDTATDAASDAAAVENGAEVDVATAEAVDGGANSAAAMEAGAARVDKTY